MGTQADVILSFQDQLPQVPGWVVLDDAVMGGASSSGLTYDARERSAVFGGSLSTAFNGGFASVRSRPWQGWSAAFAGARGVRLWVRGDGRTYKLNLKADDTWDGVTFQHDFPTQDLRGEGAAPGSLAEPASTTTGGWQEVDLLFGDFKPNFRGRLLAGQAALQGHLVRQLGFMVSKFSDVGGTITGFRAGSFGLCVRGIGALR